MAGERSEQRREHAALVLVRRACTRAFFAVIAFSLGINLLSLAAPIYMMQLYDRVITSRNADTLVMLTVIVIVALVTMAGLEAVRGFSAARVGQWLDRVLAPPIFAAIVDVASRLTGRRSAQALRDLGTVRGFVGGQAIFPLFDVPWIPIFIGVIYLIHPVLGLFSLGGTILLFVIAVGNELATRRATKNTSALSAKAYNEADAAAQNADTIAALGMLPNLLTFWDRTREEALSSQKTANERAAIFIALAKFSRMGMQVGILGLGAWLAITDEISPGSMIAASIIMGRAVAPVEGAIGTWRSMLTAVTSYGRIRELLGADTSLQSTMTLPVPEGDLIVDRVSWVPKGLRDPLLKHISLQLDGGESLGVIGPSAAGKTSLARLIVGIVAPTIGTVRLDGVEMRQWNPDDRCRYIGYLPQDVQLFNTTVKENIARLSTASDDDVIQAAQLAGAHELILELPSGYETMIGEGGVPLSGGQRQRIALARALFGEPRLVVLDEPNAHIDQAGEQALIQTLNRLKTRGTTVVMIAQRTAAINQMDKIVLLRAGSVELYGTRDEVLEQLNKTPQIAAIRPAPRVRSQESAQ